MKTEYTYPQTLVLDFILEEHMMGGSGDSDTTPGLIEKPADKGQGQLSKSNLLPTIQMDGSDDW